MEKRTNCVSHFRSAISVSLICPQVYISMIKRKKKSGEESKRDKERKKGIEEESRKGDKSFQIYIS